ncbi:MAG: hypothetical protein M1161_02840 [Candidatus Thermoplasmatota archaeon]|jgi:hypothetical protein|nr:hypothetical protein [Candidatus Thermoplasmatota archaeon]
MKTRVWSPEENEYDEVCRNPEFTNLQFVKTQKKVARLVHNHEEDRDDFFTFEMLNRDIVVKTGIRGIPEPFESINDTTKWYSAREKKWISAHPEKKQLSVEEIEKRRERMKSIRKVPSLIQFQEMTDSKGAIPSQRSGISLKSVDNEGS